MKRITQYILIISIVLIASCQHKELCYDHFHKANIRIDFQWEDSLENYPESMSLYLYPVDTGAYIRYEFTDITGGDLKIPYGLYRLLAINSDTENLEYRDKDSIYTFGIYAKEATHLIGTNIRTASLPKVKGAEESPFVMGADSLWSDRLADSLMIHQIWNDTTQVDTISFSPGLITRQISITIDDAENLKFATGGLNVSISGLSAGYYPYKDSLSKETATYLAPLKIGEDGLSVSGSIYTFGDMHQKYMEHILTVYAILSDGSKWYHTYDVTEQIHKYSDMSQITIELSGLPLPAPMFNGGGILPEVDDWQYTEVPITM